jgi:hypothetical protein
LCPNEGFPPTRHLSGTPEADNSGDHHQEEQLIMMISQDCNSAHEDEETENLLVSGEGDVRWTPEDQAHFVESTKSLLAELLKDEKCLNMLNAWADANRASQAVKLLLLYVTAIPEAIVAWCEGKTPNS